MHSSPTTSGLRLHRTAAAAALAALLLAAGSCSHDPDPASSPSGTSTPNGTSTPPGEAAPATAPLDPACEPSPGRTVELLPDVTVASVEVAAVNDDDGTELAPGFTLPAQVVDGGCVVRYDAPGGCLGAVEVTGASIPPAVIPETVAQDRVYPAVEIPGASRAGARVEQVCRVEQDGELLGVTRAGVVREGFSRNGGARPGDALVPTIRLPPVRVPDVDVEPERLESRRVPGQAGLTVLTGKASTSYVAPAGVLFDSDRAALRPEAVSALRAIARRMDRAGAARSVLVEGHTDDRGDEAYGMRLSRARARAVATWLVREGALDRRTITTRGFGESRPAYPNDSDDNRARNRRVVITVVR